MKNLVKRKPVITLVGVRQANEGFAFLYQGPNPECKHCKYFEVCINNLDVGRVYQVVKPREKIFPCKFHEGGVRVVEVVESDVSASIPITLAIEGAVIAFPLRECSMKDCKSYELCFPSGLIEGDRCKVIEVEKNISCSRGLSLVRAVLRRLPS